MRRVTLLLLIFISMVTFSMSAFAKKFTGYDRSPSGETLILTEPIDRIEETKSEFLILLLHHAAFYRFPKIPENESRVREYLNARIKNKSPIVVQIDPKTAQILYINDP